jgi:PAS domain S-box-containing protein
MNSSLSTGNGNTPTDGVRLSGDALEQSLYNMLMQAPAAMAIVHGPEHSYTFANPLYQKLYGRAGEQLIGRTIKQVWPEVENQGIYELFHQVFTSGETFTAHEYPASFSENGRVHSGYYDFILKPVKDLSGTTTDIMIHSVEVTERVTARKKIEESESYFRRMADTVPTMLWITDKDGSCTYLNRRWYETTGQTPEEALGFGWLEATHPEDAERAGHAFLTASNTRTPFHCLYRLRQNNGEYRWAIDSGSPRFDANGNFEGFIGSVTDVHEEKEASQKLERSETRYRHIFENTPVSLWEEDFSIAREKVLALKEKGITDLRSYFLEHKEEMLGLVRTISVKDVNEAALDLMEASSKEELTRGLGDIFIEDTTEAFIGEMEIIASGGGFFEYNTALQTLTGKRLEVLVHISFPYSTDYSSIIVTLVDITGRKNIEQRIKESEERYAITVQASDLGLWDFDVINQKIVASGNMAAIYGISSNEEMTVPDFLNNIHPDDSEELRKTMASILDGTIAPSFVTEYRLIRKQSGEMRWVRAKGKAFVNEDGILYRTIGTIADITEQKEAEVKLRESENRFRTLAESLPQMIWVMDAKGNTEYSSRHWKVYSGGLDGWEAWEEMIHPEDRRRSEAAFSEALSSGIPFRMEVRLKSSEGEYRWHYSVAEPVKNEEGTVLMWIGALTDIHVQRTFTEKLEKEVAERTSELQRSNEDLQQFAHVASHDLKEPVRKVKVFTTRTIQEFADGLPERARTYLTKIESSADRMFAMINGVLQYSTLVSLEHTKEDVDLNGTIGYIENDLELVILQKKAVIEYAVLPVVKGSSTLLYQLFYNLINNSLKFSMPDVPPVVRITSGRVRGGEDLRLKDDEEYIKISLTDNGIGFDQDEAERIFQTFSRLNARDKYEGTGLGLSLCRKIVERHGGIIYAEGKRGAGSSFTVILPV